MSFEVALEHCIATGSLVWDVHHKCYLVSRDAPREFCDLVDYLSTVRMSMRNLEDQFKDQESPLVQSGEKRIRNMVAMIGAVSRTLKQIDRLVARYQVIQQPGGQGKKLWGKVLWAREVPGILDLKQQLVFHTNTIDLHLSIMGNSLGKIEAILQNLVTAVSEQNSVLNNERIPYGYSTNRESTGELSVDLTGVRSWGGLSKGESLAELAVSSPNIQTREETVAVQQIFAEAEEKLVRHGRTAVLENSRKNSVKTRRKTNSGIGLAAQARTPGSWAVEMTPRRKPRAKTLDSNKRPLSNAFATRWSAIGTLGGSVNYMPNVIVNRAFFACRDQLEGTDRWPTSFQQWIRVAEWWFLKGKLTRKEQGWVSFQAYIYFSKASWILCQIIQQSPGFKHEMHQEDIPYYGRLLDRIESDYRRRNPSTPIPTRNLDLASLDVDLLEPTQPEEDSLGQYSKEYQSAGGDRDILDPNPAQQLRIHFQSFVAIEFGGLKPTGPPDSRERTYLFTLFYEPEGFKSWIHVCNQTGTLRITRTMDPREMDPWMDPRKLTNWIEMKYNGNIVYAGFTSTNAAVPYAVEYNFVRKELLEMPYCLYELGVEKVRYLDGSKETITTSATSIGFVERTNADHENSRFREFVVPGKFTTTEIPLHVIKVVPSNASPLRAAVFWPTFELPVEDIRDYIQKGMDAYMGYVATKFPEEFYLSPLYREMSVPENFTSNVRLFLEIKFRGIEDRVMDIDENNRTDRMLEVLFSAPEDLQHFTANIGGQVPGPDEILVFVKVTQTKQIRVFRHETLGILRLAYAENDIYCNFYADDLSSYKITPDGSLSLWNIMWSPSGDTIREDYNYHVDSIDLGVMNTDERDRLLVAMVSPEGTGAVCASMVVSRFNGQKPSAVGARFAKVLGGPGISANEAVVVLTKKSQDAPVEVIVFGKIRYREISRRGEHLRLSGMVAKYSDKIVPKDGGRVEKANVRLTITAPVLHTFHRERGVIKLLRKTENMVGELGIMGFLVDATEWRAAVERLDMEQD